jgi:hypothetical protein
MNILLMNTVEEVLKHALVRPVVPIEWDENAEAAALEAKAAKSGAADVVKH